MKKFDQKKVKAEAKRLMQTLRLSEFKEGIKVLSHQEIIEMAKLMKAELNSRK